MPLGIERINARRKQPNDRIAFIKPLEGPDKALAEDFLERIAAICNPIMKEHHLSIMSLEEYEPNLEFVGRNFNAGEVIQLVLKAPYTGHWLPFKYVQMVMMHELAHCQQMNHSRAFWKIRNAYASDLKTLWAKGYTGEGMWSRGITLVSGQYERDGLEAGEVMPEHLCGGTFRSSGKRKRRSRPKSTHKERVAKRIAQKFGKNGTPLGADEETKIKLENGKRVAGKPRVAGSARGRELRAAAALARFEIKKEQPGEPDEEDSTSETDSENETDIPAVDMKGARILDRNGRGMVKVCEDEDKSDPDAQNEMSELRNFDMRRLMSSSKMPQSNSKLSVTESLDTNRLFESNTVIHHELSEGFGKETIQPPAENTVEQFPERTNRVCDVCSMGNDLGAPTCIVCANVLDAAQVPSIWHCQSDTCKDGKYINAGDCGICGACGARKYSKASDLLG